MLRAPLLHFLALGSLIVAARSRWEPPAEPRPRVVLTAADLDRLRAAWRDEHGAPPDGAAERALLRDAVDEEILYREAVAAGFDRGDPSVRERLVRLGSFVGETTDGDRAALEAAARRLGLARSDVVIRRHLVDMMRLALERPAPGEAPTEAALEAYRVQHAAELTAPATVRLTHVYFGAETRGAAAGRDALAALEQLRQGAAGPDTVGGDAFMRGAEIGPVSRDGLERIFGGEFAAAVDGAPLGTWVGPIRSSYGLHVVRVRDREPARLPPLAEIRSRVLLGLVQEGGEARAAARLRALRARYDVALP